MKYDELTNVGAHLRALPDTGYTAICPYCSDRYMDSVGMIGQSREIVLKRCESCEKAYTSKVMSRRMVFHKTENMEL